jgi:hypothetical protein
MTGAWSSCRKCMSFLGGLDFAVNNAGIADHPGFLHELPAGG